MDNRELDCLVAEKIMGLQVVAHDWPCGYEPECGCYEADQTKEPNPIYGRASWYTETGPVYPAFPDGWPPRVDGYAAVTPVPHYSSDIAAAWPILEQFDSWKINHNPGYPPEHAYRVILCRYPKPLPEADPGCHAELHAATVPLAICRASLRALGVDLAALGADQP